MADFSVAAKFHDLVEKYYKKPNGTDWEKITQLGAEVAQSGDNNLMDEYGKFLMDELPTPLCA